MILDAGKVIQNNVQQRVYTSKGMKISPNTLLVEVYAERAGLSLTLPRAKDFAYKMLAIVYVSGSNTVTVKQQQSDTSTIINGAGSFVTSLIMSDSTNQLLLLCNGRGWYETTYSYTS